MRDWETQEAINFLLNDEDAYLELQALIEDAEDPGEVIQQWVEEGNAPAGLYASFAMPPVSDFNSVDWNEVAKGFEA